MEIGETLSILVASAMTLALMSYLWRENTVYRIFEHAFIGAAAGWGAISTAQVTWTNYLEPSLKTSWLWYLTIPVGLMYLFFFSKKYFWLYRYPIALSIGSGLGVSFFRTMKTSFIEQLRGLMIIKDWQGVLLVVGTITALFYFYATREHTGPFRYVSETGTWFLMIGFGAQVGTAVMARISLFIARANFLLSEPAYYMIPVALVLLAIGVYRDYRKKLIETQVL